MAIRREAATLIDASRYARAVQRHALLVVVTATLAVALTVIISLVFPQRYRATADVVVLLPDTQTGSLLATTAQAVSDFEGAIRSSAVAELTAEEAGVPASYVSDGLKTEPLAGGTIVEVTFTGSDPDVAETIVTTASRAAIMLLLDARLGPVSQRLDASQRAMTEANRAYEAFIIETELIDPEEFFFQQQRRLADLQEDQDQAEIDGDDEAAASIQERIDVLLQTVAPLRTEFDALRTAREQAAAGLQEARGAFATADASLQAAEEASSITALPATRVPRTERLPSQLLVVVVIASALTIGMIVLLELLAPQRLTKAAALRPSDAEPEAPLAVAAGRGPDAARPAAPMRVAAERAPRPADPAEARPAPSRAESAPKPRPRRPEAAPTKPSAEAAPNRARAAREPLQGSAARAVSEPRELVPPDRAAATREAARLDADRERAERTASAPSSERAPAGAPSSERAPAGAPSSERAPAGAPSSEPAPAAGAPSSERAPAAGAPSPPASDAATPVPGGAGEASDGGRRPEAKPSGSSEPAKRSRNRGKNKKRRSSASDAASSVGATQGPPAGAAAPASGESDRASAVEKASAEGEVGTPTKQRRSSAGRQGRPVVTQASDDDRGAPAKLSPEPPAGEVEEADASSGTGSAAAAAGEDVAAEG